jgi:hypothetical protein
MPDWLDLVLLDNEAALDAAVSSVSGVDRDILRSQLIRMLGLSEDDVEQALLRLLIERVRPFALPAAVWRRPVDATWSVRDAARTHLGDLGVEATDDRLRALQELYVRFNEVRSIGMAFPEEKLKRQNYACTICGLRFYNDELSETGLESPLGARPRLKADVLKPHWSDPKLRRPSVEHVWPVSMFGDNSMKNIVITCRGCNRGKSDYMSPHQTRALVGLTPLGASARSRLIEQGTLPLETFFAQMLRQPTCQRTGRTWRDCELTVELRRPSLSPVIDNLVTVAAAVD